MQKRTAVRCRAASHHLHRLVRRTEESDAAVPDVWAEQSCGRRNLRRKGASRANTRRPLPNRIRLDDRYERQPSRAQGGNATRARLDGTAQTAGVEGHPRGAGKLWLEFSSRYNDADWLFNSSVTSTCAQTGAPVAGQALNEAYASYKECVRRSTATAIRCRATPQPFALARTTPASTT